ncbi:hypothetical protein KIN20_036845 [Parelaphostrongylus tenuis]|uniref:Uncharacterized protein n=1 Tax=Parelaphostrongylus tenuis TaxID=148309 RepID=A0AAD5WKV9_PARTN|nr:hypothetical protein KIN20_036845 [Parelaphostrongylus tenuis]
MWSPWSFCSNNVMVRVRACSTVRGFKCAGHNKLVLEYFDIFVSAALCWLGISLYKLEEFQSCDSSLLQVSSSLNNIPSGAIPEKSRDSSLGWTNIDAVDPYREDRRLAMHQLYDDYEVEVPNSKKDPQPIPTRPATPTDPIIIAQYAQRHPQPPGITGIPTSWLEEQHPIYVSVERTTLATSSPGARYTTILGATSTPETPSTVLGSSFVTTSNTLKTTTTTTTTTTATKPMATSTTTTSTSIILVGNTTEGRPNAVEVDLTDLMVFKNNTYESVRTNKKAGPEGIEQIEKIFSNDAAIENIMTDGQQHAHVNDKKQFPSISTVAPTIGRSISTITSGTSSAKLHSNSVFHHRAHSQRIHVAENMIPTSFVFAAPNFQRRNTLTKFESAQPLPKHVITSEVPQSSYEQISYRGRQSRLRRLKMLNRRARMRPLTVVAIDSEVQGKTNDASDLTKEIYAVQKRINYANKLAMGLKTTSRAPNETVESDTARAISWMFANMAKMMKENSNKTIDGARQQVNHDIAKA